MRLTWLLEVKVLSIYQKGFFGSLLRILCFLKLVRCAERVWMAIKLIESPLKAPESLTWLILFEFQNTIRHFSYSKELKDFQAFFTENPLENPIKITQSIDNPPHNSPHTQNCNVNYCICFNLYFLYVLHTNLIIMFLLISAVSLSCQMYNFIFILV